ncbi:hypothetical protein ACJJTC_012240 [Scirpophaga incertulas]
MGSFVLVGALVVAVAGGVRGHVVEPTNDVTGEHSLDDTELVLAFVVFRHGDRTPDQEELDLYSGSENYSDIFYPYGKKALTNKGKQRGYLVGEYLRSRYDGLISKLYLSDDIVIRTTDYARTKMTALTALAALYPPLPAQKWNPALDWQPIPYNTIAPKLDDLLYWYWCPRYLWLRDQIYEYPEMKALIKPYEKLFSYMSEHTGRNITKPEDVFYLDNLFQTLENVGIPPPQWAVDVMPDIREMTKIEYAAEFFVPELRKLASGVLLNEVLNVSATVLSGNKDQPKLWLYSAHENNVAALMSAARVFEAHQPSYGSTFSLELRRHRSTGDYGFTAVYARSAGGPAEILPIQGCQNQLFCEYGTFVSLTRDTVLSLADYKKQCPIME